MFLWIHNLKSICLSEVVYVLNEEERIGNFESFIRAVYMREYCKRGNP